MKNENYFKQSWNYIKESKAYIYFASAIFAFFIILALAFPTPTLLEEQLKEIIRNLVDQTASLNTFQLICYIFSNNLWVSIMGIFFGIIFCIAPFFIALSNGYVVGFVIKTIVNGLGMQEGIISLWRLIPYGIFELPAVLISLGIGLRLGVSAFLALKKNSFKILLNDLKRAVKLIIYIIFPLLLIAAIIEGLLIMILG
jgi:stage II sporulation protein M